MAVNLFLDANVFLSFFDYGEDDLETMHKAVKLIKDEEIVLHVNDHLKNEISRNRHSRLSQSLRQLGNKNYGRSFPQFCKSFTQHAEINKKLSEIGKLHQELLADIEQAIRASKLSADDLIADLLASANPTKITEKIIQSARDRVDLGCPPGKNKSLGDAIHWECLINEANLRHLNIVSEDGDFASALYAKEIDPVLSDEWANRKSTENLGASVTLYETLTAFFRARFPKFELSIETIKDEAIERLRNSRSFAETHAVVADLSQFEDFTQAQVKALISALLSNGQVRRIGTDGDIKSFYLKLKNKVWLVCEDADIEKAEEHLGLPRHELSLPF